MDSCIYEQKVQYTQYMNKIKELIASITKKAWIIGGIVLLIVIGAGITVWPFNFFQKDVTTQDISNNENLEKFVENATEDIFTKEDIINGKYKNDTVSATTYVQNTQEVLIAVVADTDAQKVVDTKKVSCGHLAFVTTRVAHPAVLTNSIKALFENKVDTDFLPGNIIPSYHPDLTLEKVVIENGVAQIYLGGNFSGTHDGWCDASLAIAQIVETAQTFDTVTSVEVYQGDKKVY
jgi:hypothetical protein